ncbi:MAG: hypothetical protein E7395_01820 [Ruminococcaceae bacterium]|nr:hypothetical protein [Oscillospiraceae bacterium]
MKSKRALFLTTAVILLLACTAVAVSLSVFSPIEQEEPIASEQPLSEISLSSAMAQNMKDNITAISTMAFEYDMSNLSYEEYIDIESYVTFILL